MQKPLIGITTTRKEIAALPEGKRYDNLLHDEYSLAISRAGGMPLLIPIDFPLDDLPHLLDKLEGILLSGGGDIYPDLYGQENDSYSKNKSRSRDRLENSLVKLVLERDLPLLGICRGHQMLNVASGGTLYTDIDQQYNTDIQHQQSKQPERGQVVHDVEIVKGSRLTSITGKQSLGVNSRHHQAIRQIAPGFVVTARAIDGLIEGIEHPGQHFCMGVQWHPESLPEMEDHRAIFKAFINAAMD